MRLKMNKPKEYLLTHPLGIFPNGDVISRAHYVNVDPNFRMNNLPTSEDSALPVSYLVYIAVDRTTYSDYAVIVGKIVSSPYKVQNNQTRVKCESINGHEQEDIERQIHRRLLVGPDAPVFNIDDIFQD